MSDGNQIKDPTIDFDPDALREKYKQERDKRLREDGKAQYITPTGEFESFIWHDPNVEPGYTREPVTAEVDVAIIGGGFGGLLAAVKLAQAGVKNIRIIEAGADFGGTWYWNRYPGAQCDIDAFCYLPLLEETGYIPKEKYSYADEIFEFSQFIGRKFGLYDSALFQTRARDIRWDESIKRWRVNTIWNDDIRARFVIIALGTTSQLRLPGIPGIADFEGHSFHSSRWDFSYTGGDNGGGMDKLHDKRVAVIGTGASGVQIVPHLARDAKHLYVFQRTPQVLPGPRDNKLTDPEWAASLKPGWQRERRDNLSAIVSGQPYEVDLVKDGLTKVFTALRPPGMGAALATASPEEVGRQMELNDFKTMNEVRAYVDSIVKDPAVADALKPWYRIFCKRLAFSDEYLAAFNRPNVTLVDVSASKGVERITKTGVVANGVEYEVDCIIYASGFEIGGEFKRRIGFDIYGRDGLALHDYWAKGMRTLHGYGADNFPNWFFVGISQNGLSVNMTAMFEDQAEHVAYIISQAMERGAQTVEPSPEAVDDWVTTIRTLSAPGEELSLSCTPGPSNDEGSKDQSHSHRANSYAPGINAFNDLIRDWRDEGNLKGLILR